MCNYKQLALCFLFNWICRRSSTASKTEKAWLRNKAAINYSHRCDWLSGRCALLCNWLSSQLFVQLLRLLRVFTNKRREKIIEFWVQSSLKVHRSQKSAFVWINPKIWCNLSVRNELLLFEHLNWMLRMHYFDLCDKQKTARYSWNVNKCMIGV